MMDHPYVAIDLAYHQEMEQAIAGDPAAFQAALQQAETTRQAAKEAAAAALQAFEAEVAAGDANAATLRDKANTALAANSTFLALASPTNPQTLTQVKALTRQTNAIIRLMVSALDDVSDT